MDNISISPPTIPFLVPFFAFVQISSPRTTQLNRSSSLLALEKFIMAAFNSRPQPNFNQDPGNRERASSSSSVSSSNSSSSSAKATRRRNQSSHPEVDISPRRLFKVSQNNPHLSGESFCSAPPFPSHLCF